MEQDLAGKLKCLNRSLPRNRILSLKIKKGEQEILRSSLGEDDMFNLKVALHSCDTFEQLYEFIEIL